MEDEFLWLEDVEGKAALDWVRAQNKRSEAALVLVGQQQRSEAFEKLKGDLRAILDSDARIPAVYTLADRGHLLYNLWRDSAHELGLWRRASLAEYRRGAACNWEPVLDLDALAVADAAEGGGVRCVFAGASDCCSGTDRCLLHLSRGGADATSTREFDVAEKRFVSAAALDGGFVRPEAKGSADWVDADTVLVRTDFGDGRSMTASGYPRSVRLWRRGQPLSAARVLFEVPEGDLSAHAAFDPTEGFARTVFTHSLNFYADRMLVCNGAHGVLAEAPRLVPVSLVPDDAEKSLHRDWLLLKLRSPAFGFAPGSLIATRLSAWLEAPGTGASSWHALFVPSERVSLESFCRTPTRLLLTVLDNVRTRLFVATPTKETEEKEGWKVVPFAAEKYGLPLEATLSVRTLDEIRSEEFFVTASSHILPPTLFYGILSAEDDGAPLERLRSTPEMFDASGLVSEQFHAVSEDGTKVPYTVVHRAGIALDSTHPTLLYGYGGFEVSLIPSYAALVGKAWLEPGFIFAEANIRGGGEFGPAWHQAALKDQRKKAYEDFEAVARDLFARGFTTPQRLGIKGGSNGGMMVLNTLLRHPELYGAVVCSVPLADMKRYTHLLAGHSWAAEYGDPDSTDWENFLRQYSPYHNVPASSEGKKLPPVLFTTSTRDDRVHPGHARKMCARMAAAGHDVLLFENIEGGHGGAASNEQTALLQALGFTFLRQRLLSSSS